MKGSNRKSKNHLVILLIVFLLALAVGYAAFSDTLTITGTANAGGTFDLEFTSCTVTNTVGVDATATKGEISTDKDTLTVTVADLAYPGAGAEFDVVITNVGSVPAKVKSVTPKNITGSTNIVITGLDAITTSHPTITSQGTCNLNFTVEWPANSTAEIKDGEEVSFELVIEYEQDTSATFEGTNSHTDTNPTV